MRKLIRRKWNPVPKIIKIIPEVGKEKCLIQDEWDFWMARMFV